MNKWGIWKYRNKRGEIDPGVTQEHLSGVSKAASNQLRQIFCLAVWGLCELLCLYWSCYCSPAVKWQMDVSILRDLWLLADSCFQNSCIIELSLVLQEGRKTKMGGKKSNKWNIWCQSVLWNHQKYISIFFLNTDYFFSEGELLAFGLFMWGSNMFSTCIWSPLTEIKT